MAYPVENIINIATNLSPAGIGTANFGVGMFFANFDSTTTVGFAEGSFRDYTTLAEVAADFATSEDAYIAASAWFSALPRPRSFRILRRIEGDTAVQSINKAIAAGIWFYWFDFESGETATADAVTAIQAAGDASEKFFAFTATGALATAVRDPGVANDVCSAMVSQGSRRAMCFTHATARYAGLEAAAILSTINFSAINSTKTLEFKKLPGITAEDLSTTAYTAMMTKGAPFYTKVETGGQVDNGRVINSKSTSSFGEFIDDVFNLDAFVNALRVGLYNALANVAGKVPQTPAGQLYMNNAAAQVGEQYIKNGYLGEAQYVDEETGETKTTRGYRVITKPEAILSLSSADRAARKCAPVQIIIYRAGAIHAVDVTVDVI